MSFWKRFIRITGTAATSAAWIVVITVVCLGAFPAPARAQQVLSSASEIDYPPFCIVDEDGAVTGFSNELLRAAARAMGVEVTFRTGPWSQVKAWLTDGEVQALPLVGRTPERELVFDFTVPYMTLHGAIVVRKDTTDLRTIEGLRGKKVGVMKGDNAEEYLRREGLDAELVTTLTFTAALQELAAGRLDAVVVQRLVALRLIEELGLTDLRIVDEPLKRFRQDFSFAVREGDRETLALLNEGLALVMADGTYRQLHAKWFAALELPTNRRIIVGGDRNYPPFEYLDAQGRPAGYNVDLTRTIARELGIEVEFRLDKWSEIVQAFENGEIDVLQGIFYTPRRDLKYDFSQPHIANHYVAISRNTGPPPPRSLADLKNLRIVVERGDVAHDFLIEQGLKRRMALADDAEVALRELAGGQHDAALIGRLASLHLIEKNGWTGLRLGQTPLISLDYCYAVQSGRKALLAQFDEGLRLVEQSGELRRIQEKWFGRYREKTPTTAGAVFRASLKYVLPLLALLCLVFLWSWALRRQVARKTLELAAAAEKFRNVFEAANVGKSLTRPSGEVHVNQAFCDFLGYTRDELEGKTWMDLTPPEDIEPTRHFINCLLSGEQGSVRFEKRYLHKDGTVLWADVSSTVWRSQDGRPEYLITTIVNIDDRKRAEGEQKKLEAQLRQAQKMESVGRLAGGVAHDFNNMLGVILGFTDLALEKVDETSQVHADLTEILTAAKRSADITRQLLAFARQQTIAPHVLDLNATVADMLRMLRRLIGEDVQLTWIPEEPLGTVYMDPAQLHQILANLCINARDALDGGGKIILETHNHRIDEPFCAQHPGAKPGEYVLLVVSDDGRGMPPEVLEQIFEPFFTTKELGKGTGLGLSTVYGIVKQNDGFVHVYSETGKGTTFQIYLPRHATAEAPVEAVVEQEISPGRKETILLVEDESSILRLAKRILEKAQYTVLDASSPNQAMELAQAHAGEIQLLITDVVMPEQNGRELASALQARFPGLRVLFMSGYTANVITERGVLGEGVHFIQKPFTNRALAQKVREALDAPPSPVGNN